MAVDVRIRNGPFPDVSRSQTRTWLARMLDALGMTDSELSVLYTSDKAIHLLNLDYRGKDKPTDVLAFAMREGEGGEISAGLLGDIVISVETARRQAIRHRRELSSEVMMLLAHGLLHLLGYDHQTDEQESEMKCLTRDLCRVAKEGAGRPVVTLAQGGPLASRSRVRVPRSRG